MKISHLMVSRKHKNHHIPW